MSGYALEALVGDEFTPVHGMKPGGFVVETLRRNDIAQSAEVTYALEEDRRRWALKAAVRGSHSILDLLRSREERVRRERWHARRWVRRDFMPPMPLDVLTCHH